MSNKTILQSNNEALSANNLDLQSLIDQANALPDAGSVELPSLTNEGSAADLMLGKELIDADGSKVTGTFSIDSELNTQDSLITQIQSALQRKAVESGNIELWTGTVCALTLGGGSGNQEICYTDSTLTFCEVTLPLEETMEITIPANTIIFLSQGGNGILYGNNFEILFDDPYTNRIVIRPTANNFVLKFE